MHGTYYVYIMANASGMLYTGVTNDLAHRVREHKQHLIGGHTARHDITRLVYCEAANDVQAAIAREKQIRGRVRSKKTALIESANRDWHDLSDGWFGCGGGSHDARQDPSLRSG